jgi:hypothetical protein
MQEWILRVTYERGFWSTEPDPYCIIYWQPWPEPPDTYTPRGEEEEDLIYFHGMYDKEERVMEYLKRRKARNAPMAV